MEQTRLQDIINKRKEQNKIRQQRYRDKIKGEVENGKKSIEEVRTIKREQMKKYREGFKTRENALLPPKKEEPVKEIVKEVIKKPVVRKSRRIEPPAIQEVVPDVEEVQTRTRGRPKKKQTDIQPRNGEKTDATIEGYINKIKKIHSFLSNVPFDKSFVPQLRLLYKNETFYQSIITINMKYIKDIDKVINLLNSPEFWKSPRQPQGKLPEANTIKAWLIPVSVLLGKLKGYNTQYQKTTKYAIEINKRYVENREKNILEEEDEGKIIKDFDNDKVMLENVDKIKNKKDKVIYVLAMRLQRRLEIRSMKLADTNTEFDEISNYLVVDEKNEPIQAIFQDFKTMKDVPDIEPIPENIKGIIKDYLDTTKIPIGKYVLGQKDKRLVIDQPNFSKKIKTIFKKLYGAEISNNWVRQSFAAQFGEDNLEVVKRLEADAKRAGHSIGEHIRYMRFSKQK